MPRNIHQKAPHLPCGALRVENRPRKALSAIIQNFCSTLSRRLTELVEGCQLALSGGGSTLRIDDLCLNLAMLGVFSKLGLKGLVFA